MALTPLCRGAGRATSVFAIPLGGTNMGHSHGHKRRHSHYLVVAILGLILAGGVVTSAAMISSSGSRQVHWLHPPPQQ